MRFLFLFIWLSCAIHSAFAQELSALSNWLTGTFVTVERPDDYKAFVVWSQKVIKTENDSILIYHQRATIRTMNKPYNQQIWKLVKKEEGVILQHYDIRSNINGNALTDIDQDSLQYLSDMDILLRNLDNEWIGMVSFVNPDYLSRFVEGGHHASVRLRVSSTLIEYHLKIFNDEDKQIYGPKELGYILKKK